MKNLDLIFVAMKSNYIKTFKKSNYYLISDIQFF